MSPAKSQSEHPQPDFAIEVKTLLLQRGSNVTALASKLGKARNTVSVAINHPTMLPSIKNLIRLELGMSS